MTNEELLQQAKDQVAKKEGWKDYKQYLHPSMSPIDTDKIVSEAALLAIQSAREEAAKELKEYKEHCEHLAQQLRMLGECRTDQIKAAREEGRKAGWEQGWKDGYDQCQHDSKN